MNIDLDIFSEAALHLSQCPIAFYTFLPRFRVNIFHYYFLLLS
jgi:hypothetical protein